MGREAGEGILGRQLIMGAGGLDHGGAGSKGAWQNRSESCNYRIGGKYLGPRKGTPERCPHPGDSQPGKEEEARLEAVSGSHEK